MCDRKIQFLIDSSAIVLVSVKHQSVCVTYLDEPCGRHCMIVLFNHSCSEQNIDMSAQVAV